ncbi:hypothetical protein HQQ81_21030 [Microbacteriaceae bacterium VKM Ac-2854]|nr:hypothetical protein [Microbacteriaceae bacterium VKM Ac-2854]
MNGPTGALPPDEEIVAALLETAHLIPLLIGGVLLLAALSAARWVRRRVRTEAVALTVLAVTGGTGIVSAAAGLVSSMLSAYH